MLSHQKKAVTKAEFDTKKSQNAQLDRLKNVETGKPVVDKATLVLH